ncbi:uncharacterized protein METZ01_LOCUS434221, partial [marine metagenome]
VVQGCGHWQQYGRLRNLLRCKGFFIALTDPHTGSAFELQLVRRGIPPEALKRGIHTMSKRKSDTSSKPSRKTEQAGSPSK